MKNTIKIIVIIVAITLAIGAVLFFITSIVNSPSIIKRTNQYSDDLSECMSSLKNAPYPSKEDSIYRVSLNRIEIFRQENRIDSDDADKYYERLLGIYCPKFLSRCFEKFYQSVWYKDDHTKMIRTIAELENIKLSDGSSALKYKTRDSLDVVLKIISDYNKAWQVSQQTSYKGINQTQEIINSANQYKNDTYLSNCTQLYNALDAVKPSLADSHYNYISREVDKLKNYTSSSDVIFMSQVDHVKAKIDEYDKKAQSLYGYKKNTKNLKDLINDYWDIHNYNSFFN